MKIDITYLTKGIHFPPIVPIATEKPIGFFAHVSSFISFKRLFQVHYNYAVWSEHLQYWILIPKSFTFDGASVPKVFHSVYNPVGALFYGAIPHDFGYIYEGLLLIDDMGEIFFKRFSKDELDEIFRKLCDAESGLAVSSSIAKKALIAAYFIWRNYRKKARNVMEDYDYLFENESILPIYSPFKN